MKSGAPPEIESVDDARRAAVLMMHPLRLSILSEARTPASATEIAERLGLARQKVNYHLRELARARFVRRAGERRKRNFIERRFVATARAYVLSPEVLGPVVANWRKVEDAMSASYLLALASQVQSDLGRAAREAQAQGKRLSTLAMVSELRFESAAQREAFAAALSEAIVEVVGRHAAPEKLSDGRPGPGRPYRLVVGCYPIPAPEAPQPPDAADERGEEPSEHYK